MNNNKAQHEEHQELEILLHDAVEGYKPIFWIVTIVFLAYLLSVFLRG